MRRARFSCPKYRTLAEARASTFRVGWCGIGRPRECAADRDRLNSRVVTALSRGEIRRYLESKAVLRPQERCGIFAIPQARRQDAEFLIKKSPINRRDYKAQLMNEHSRCASSLDLATSASAGRRRQAEAHRARPAAGE